MAFVALHVQAIAFPSLPSTSCRDIDNRCTSWAATGECKRNVGYMTLHACRVACGSCGHDASDLVAAIRASPEEQIDLVRTRNHGSCTTSPPTVLRWAVDSMLASQIGCFNRKGAEPSGYWQKTLLLHEAQAQRSSPITFYDTITSRPLFRAPINRTMAEFLKESTAHGWPSFREQELIASGVRALRDSGGEVVSVDGTHLGHNLPDSHVRYCINLVSIAGWPPADEQQNGLTALPQEGATTGPRHEMKMTTS